MNIRDYKDGMIVRVKNHSYGTYKTHRILDKSPNKARMVQVLHSAVVGDINWDFAFVREFRLVDIYIEVENNK